MARFFIEVAYKGSAFCGFQKQPNQPTIQGLVETALAVILRNTVETTTSSRTDTGVHARQNFLHFDYNQNLPTTLVYNANAILHEDIIIRNISLMQPNAHSRFDALSRTYEYIVYQTKNPFLKDFGYFYPFKLDYEKLQAAATLFLQNTYYQSFCKRHTEVNNFNCQLEEVQWEIHDDFLKFRVKGNRFLRGMVRAMVGTSLLVGRGKITLDDLQRIIDANDCQEAEFSAEAKGLQLIQVEYPAHIFY